jgi:hypothetical protein
MIAVGHIKRRSSMLWFHFTYDWLREDSPGHPGQLVAKAGSKWHLVDMSRPADGRVYTVCDSTGVGEQGIKASEVIFEEATKIQPGLAIPTPGRGIHSACSFCFKAALKLYANGSR